MSVSKPQASPDNLSRLDLDSVAELNTLIADGNVATIAGEETLTNKTLTAPVVTSALEAVVSGSGAPNVLLASESGKVITNAGVTAQAYNTLPSAAAGLTFTFTVVDADGIRVTAAAGDDIRVGETASATAGFIQNLTIGSSITLTATNATNWVATSVVGTWTVDS